MNSMSETENGVSIELTQKQYMRLRNIYNKLLKAKELTANEYDFDTFVCDSFALFLKNLKYEDVECLRW